MKVAIIGQGYVGLNLSISLAECGIQVVGIDISESLVKKLNSGDSHIEGISNEELKRFTESGHYSASVDFREIANCETVIIAVPTPLSTEGTPDITPLSDACRSIAEFVSEETLIINESTSFIGTLRNVIAKSIQEINPRVKDFAISPERVDPGNNSFRVRNTPRIVGGLSENAVERAYDLYKKFCEKVVKVSSPEVAEAAKLLENTFRFVNISFIFEFTKLMNQMKLPITEVINAASTKPFGFMPFFPNLGIGGHCIPVDPIYLQKNATDYGFDLSSVRIAQETNKFMPKYVAERLNYFLGGVSGKKILVVGLSYKSNIADVRESPVIEFIKILRELGSHVFWHDPLVKWFEGSESSNIEGNYDLAVVCADHDAIDYSRWNGNPIYSINSSVVNPSWIPLIGN